MSEKKLSKDTPSKWERIWGHVSRHQVWSAVIAGLILALLLGGIALGSRAVEDLSFFSDPSKRLEADWGPPRPTYRCDAENLCIGADHVALNSNLNTSGFGDERFFLSAKVEGDVGGVQDRLAVSPGDIVQLRLVVANNGDPNLPHERSLLTRHLAAHVELPRDPAAEAKIVAWLEAQNASPRQVYDSTIVEADEPIVLHPVEGSATLRNLAHSHGLLLSESLFDGGTLIGYRRLDGRLGTCFCEIGVILAKLVVSTA
jgi:hypothetical protein